jgi:hypothetical protein
MEDSFIYFGGALKTVDGEEGAVIGPMVTFYDGTHKDFVGDYFTKSTYLGARGGDGVDVLFHHGIPITKGIEHLASHIFAPVKAIKDDLQVWGKHVLDLADGYERKVHDLVKKGKLGWSTGALQHQVVREKDGELKRWIVGENSYTPVPCEPCNRIVAVKSLISDDFLKTVYDLESIQLIGDYSFESEVKSSSEPLVEQPIGSESGKEPAVINLPVTIKGLLADKLREQRYSAWELWSCFNRLVEEIAQAAASEDITGTSVNVQAKVTSAANELAELLIPIGTNQINGHLESGTSDRFYLKSNPIVFNALMTGEPHAGRFGDRLDMVLGAVERVANDAKEIHELRKSTKAGAKMSKARMERLRQITKLLQDLEAELADAKPDEVQVVAKSVSADEIRGLLAEIEYTDMMLTTAGIV